MSMQSQHDFDILPCPICGKMPFVSLKGLGGHGYWVTLKCKPLFGRPHLKVVEGKALPERALQYAICAWNNSVMEVKQRNEN